MYLLKAKSEVFPRFWSFHKMICARFKAKIKIMQADNGAKYMDKTFGAYLESYGIISQTSCPCTSSQNEVA